MPLKRLFPFRDGNYYDNVTLGYVTLSPSTEFIPSEAEGLRINFAKSLVPGRIGRLSDHERESSL